MHHLHEVARLKYGAGLAEMLAYETVNARTPVKWLTYIAITLRNQDMAALITVGGENGFLDGGLPN